MADYYTKFSVVVPLTKKQKEYALEIAMLAECARSDETLPGANFPEELIDSVEDWSFDTAADNAGVWLHSEDSGINSACEFIQHLLKKFKIKGSVRFAWAGDCSKPCLDAYCGGAAYITAKVHKRFFTGDWLDKAGKEKQINPD